jgi:hypothetical protein
MNIYFKVVEVQIQALEYIPKLGRDTSHPGGVLARRATTDGSYVAVGMGSK